MRMGRRRAIAQQNTQLEFAMTYTGEHRVEQITMGGVRFEQWVLLSSGTLRAVGPDRQAQIWLCGGGGGASAGGSYGGAGGYTAADYYFALHGLIPVVIGAGGLGGTELADATDGEGTWFGDKLMAKGGGRGTAYGGGAGGTAGGLARDGKAGGTGDAVWKFPFLDTVNYWPDALCAGGAGGGYEEGTGTITLRQPGGDGGTNGGGAPQITEVGTSAGGIGGLAGGGDGSSPAQASAKRNATFFGGGGGGGGGRLLSGVWTMTPGGNGYSGVAYIRLALA